ncbi:hypothetical protein GALMADRAFT_275343 [Galerina marginata CBS 339.88]|uniref:ATP-dependent DNA helicase n=1 Tax=Galerina marginata (strain CBS 339.88) TaxID=685588 RepID=A0A067TLW4_GALM3|nr:hypothetical protein GALMADRAFT_275343 [Galerina marginata CBS 339.88]
MAKNTMGFMYGALPDVTSHRYFGGLNVAIVGDFAQLPPVGDTPLYSPPSTAASDNGCLSRDDRAGFPDQVTFRILLSHASRGGLTEEEWRLLDSRSERKLSLETRQQFEDSIFSYTTRNDVHDINIAKLDALNQPCAPIIARYDGDAAAAKAPADEAGGLENHIILAKVMINRNIWQTKGVLSRAQNRGGGQAVLLIVFFLALDILP